MITSHAIASSLKSIIFLALFGSLLTACASNSTQDQDTDIQEPTVVATPIDPVSYTHLTLPTTPYV